MPKRLCGGLSCCVSAVVGCRSWCNRPGTGRYLFLVSFIRYAHESEGGFGVMLHLNNVLCCYAAQACMHAVLSLLLCVQAGYSGNVSASVSLAQIDDARGDTTSALKYWAKAAKLGHPEGQFRLGRVSVCCGQYPLLQSMPQKECKYVKAAHFVQADMLSCLAIAISSHIVVTVSTPSGAGR